jgi:hypothetical protein
VRRSVDAVFGQPSVDIGQSQLENQVSRTSSSCTTGQPQYGQAVRSSRLTITSCGGSHSVQYHTGIRCPHQSCREMFQSRMFDIQCS